MAPFTVVRLTARRFQRRRCWTLCLLWALAGFLGASHSYGAESGRPKRVLIISTGSRLAPGFNIVDQQLIQALGKIQSARIETYAENLDLIRFSSDRYQQIFQDYLSAKYAGFSPDLVILIFVGDPEIPTKLLPQIFPGTPIIVVGITEKEIKTDRFGNLIRGIVQRINASAALELMMRLQPELRRIVVITGTDEIDRQVLDRFKRAASLFNGKIEIAFWDDLSVAQLNQKVATLPPHNAILFARMFRDAAGQTFVSSQVGRWIAQSANVPVYVMSDAALGTGAVGGSLASSETFGKRAGELARYFLSGTDIKSLPLEIRTDTEPTFDWRALQRWGISENRLPPGSVVRFKPRSLWQDYRWYIIGAIIIIFLQSVMIVDLLLERRRRRQIAAVLKESQDLMELATSAGELGLWSRDLTTGDVWANEPMRSLFGFSATEPLEFKDLLGRIHPDDRERMLLHIEYAETADAPFEGEFRVVVPAGIERYVLAKGRTIVDRSESGTRRMGVVLDITERKHSAEQLEKERGFLRQVIDTTPNFIFAKDRDGRFTLANQAVADAYGTTVENLIGKTDGDFNSNKEEVESFRCIDREVMDTLEERFIPEERMTDSQGNIRWLQTVKRPINRIDGHANQVLGASTDISRRRETELELREQRAELAHVARISTMGELAASLAHELNQPLTAILSNAQAALRFLSNKPADVEEVREILDDIVLDNSRAGDVIRRMRALVKKEEPEFAPLDLATLIRDVVVLLHSDAILRSVKIALELDDDLPPVRGDKVQLQQVILNLMLNAFDAMKDCAAAEREVRLRVTREDTSLIQAGVSDRGTGLSRDKLDKIFQPFYTTKREGLGMGLSICRSIIEAHGGRLWAENNSDDGATFYFTVPVAEKAADQKYSIGPKESTASFK